MADDNGGQGSAPRRHSLVTGRRALALAIVLLVAGLVGTDWWTTVPTDQPAQYVGRATCSQCHERQTQLWQGSHHDLAMDHATPETVLGDFNDATLEYLGITARMFRRDGKYFVNTEGPDGVLADFEVKYVLGVAPLQQYMVEFDRRPDQPENEIARLQVLRECWDVQQGRWFYLPPPDVKDRLKPDDELHWTGSAQRWNSMCADCHSTNLHRNYDVDQQVYHTTYSEIDVSCEACHGPGSRHVELARGWSLFWDRKIGYGLPRLKGPDTRPQIETCAPCHSRRRLLHDHAVPGDGYYQGHANELLGELTYYADGQIRDEVYEYGSFLQSKMYHKGIRCSDCHDPHSARLKHQGNQLCTSCHTHSPGKYDGPAHTHHQPGSPGAACVACHMPETTYMEIDPRRDHSLRVPRPGLSVALGTPNACTGCHLQVDKSQDKLPTDQRAGLDRYSSWLERRTTEPAVNAELERLDRWARDKSVAWWGEKMDDSQHFARVLHLARSDPRAAESQLIRLVGRRDTPAIVQATALLHLSALDTPASLDAARRALQSSDPQVRAAATGRYETAFQGFTNTQADPRALIALYRPLVADLLPLVDDPVRLVRFEAARQLAHVPDPYLRQILLGNEYDRLDAVLNEYLEGLNTNSDRGGSHLARALVLEYRGDRRGAEAEYRTAIDIEPRTAGPRTNLATLLEQWLESLEQDRRAAESTGDPAAAQRIANAMSSARLEVQRLRREELPLLERDAQLSPQSAVVQYRLAMALYLSGDEARAEQVLLAARQVEPRNENVRYALALLYQKQQRWDDALAETQELLEIRPDNPLYLQLLRALTAREPPPR